VAALGFCEVVRLCFKPPKWFRLSSNLEVGDIVVFCKEGHEKKLGQVIWTIGRVVEATPSHTDVEVRQVKIEYSTGAEFRNGRAPLRTTNPADRSVAHLAKQGEVSLMQDLVAAAHVAARLEECMGDEDPGPLLVPAVKEKIIAYFDSSRAWAGQCAFSTESGSVCNILLIQEDLWP
jgi:hypothetical protein